MAEAQQAFWQEEAERNGVPHLAKIIAELHEGQQEILRVLAESNEKHDAARQDIDQLKLAFPERDYEGHRRYHQVLIDTLEERRKLRRAIQEKTISGLVWSAIVWLVAQAWSHLPKLWEGR